MNCEQRTENSEQLAMKRYFLIVVVLLGMVTTNAQCPTSDLFLTSQSEVDSFRILYPDCREFIEYSIFISDTRGDIENLEGLSLLTEAWAIDILNSQLTSFKGLERLRKIYGELKVSRNEQLASYQGLDSIRSIGRLIHQYNPLMESFVGLERLDSLGALEVINIDAFQFDIAGIRQVRGLRQLILTGMVEFGGFELPDSIQSITIKGNDDIYHIGDIREKLDVDIFSITIEGQTSFELRGMESYEAPMKLALIDIADLELNGAEAFEQDLELTLTRCQGIEALSALENVSLVGLWINSCDKLETLGDLSNLATLRRFSMYDNAVLNDISCLAAVDSLDIVFILDNPALSACHFPPICRAVEKMGPGNYIRNNASGCRSPQVVGAQCLTSAKDNGAPALIIYPNPSGEWIHWQDNNKNEFVVIGDMTGKERWRKSAEKGRIDVSDLVPGIYYIKTKGEGVSMVGVFIKK